MHILSLIGRTTKLFNICSNCQGNGISNHSYQITANRVCFINFLLVVSLIIYKKYMINFLIGLYNNLTDNKMDNICFICREGSAEEIFLSCKQPNSRCNYRVHPQCRDDWFDNRRINLSCPCGSEFPASPVILPRESKTLQSLIFGLTDLFVHLPWNGAPVIHPNNLPLLIFLASFIFGIVKNSSVTVILMITPVVLSIVAWHIFVYLMCRKRIIEMIKNKLAERRSGPERLYSPFEKICRRISLYFDGQEADITVLVRNVLQDGGLTVISEIIDPFSNY